MFTSNMQGQVADLNRKLNWIEENYLKPDSHEQKHKDIVQRIIVERVIQRYASDHLSSPLYAGSSYELVGVPGISDYDIQFGIKLNGHVTVEEGPESQPDWKKISGGPSHFSENGYMSVRKVRQFMQGELQRALNSVIAEGCNYRTSNAETYTVRLITNGPAITFEINGGELSVDIVLCVKATNLMDRGRKGCDFDLVAKPFHKDDLDKDYFLWRTSFSEKEKELMRQYNRPSYRTLTLYKIMKVVKSNDAQLRGLPSYFYKNAFFYLLEQYQWQGSAWTSDDSLAERFKDFIKKISSALGERDLRMYFDRKVNLLRGYPSSYLAGVKSYLDSCLRNDNFSSLIGHL